MPRWHTRLHAHRKLFRTARGEDVKRFQVGLNARLEHHPRSEGPTAVDGVFGNDTLRAWRQVRYIIGLPTWLPPTMEAQRNVRQPWTRSAAAERRAKLRRRRLGASSPGDRAADYLLGFAGRTETGYNDAPFLRNWENGLPHDRLDWMIPGQPWCGFACIAAWYYGAGKLLPDGTVYTPNIVNWARARQGFKAVAASQAQAGDLVVFDFNGGGADHVGLALGPARNGLIPTVEGNTSAGNAGSQSNGGGVFKRSRPVGLIAVVARPI